MTDKPIHYRETPSGFEYGAAMVRRVMSHEGYVAVAVLTKHRAVFAEVSPSGRSVRVREEKVDRKHWKPEEDAL